MIVKDLIVEELWATLDKGIAVMQEAPYDTNALSEDTLQQDCEFGHTSNPVMGQTYVGMGMFLDRNV